MRGFPLLNLLATVLLLAAVLFPLVRAATARLDAERAERRAETTSAPETGPAAVPVTVTLRMVQKPEKILVGADNVSPTPELETRVDLRLPMTEGAVEFPLTITWPEGTENTVAEVRVEPEGLESRTANVWSEGRAAEETLRFEWKGNAKP